MTGLTRRWDLGSSFSSSGSGHLGGRLERAPEDIWVPILGLADEYIWVRHWGIYLDGIVGVRKCLGDILIRGQGHLGGRFRVGG